MIEIRPLTSADSDAIAALFAHDGGYAQRVHGRPASASDVEDFLTAVPPGLPTASKHSLGLIEDGELVAVADVIDGYPEPGVAYIGLLQVKGSAQGHGHGRRLHDAARELLPGVGRWRLSVIDANAQATAFWERLGYQRTAEERPWTSPSGAERTAFVMEAMRVEDVSTPAPVTDPV